MPVLPDDGPGNPSGCRERFPPARGFPQAPRRESLSRPHRTVEFGEIFLNPQLLQILELAHERKVALAAGNGVNLNNVRDEVLEGVVKFKLQGMTCSIDGASQETYELYRVRGKFENVIANIKKINHFKQLYRSEFPRLRWQFIVFGHNEHELTRARRMAQELGMEFYAKLSWDDDLSPISDKEAVRRETQTGAATRAEFKERYGRDYKQNTCHQLWDVPQVNWDGKVLGCGRNFWGDFGGNAFADGLIPSLNTEKITYARKMLRGQAVARQDIPCTTCEIYLDMRANNRWLEREDFAGGQIFPPGRRAEAALDNKVRGLPNGFAPASAALGLSDATSWDGIRRNDVCPCGSGKKYKHCHGRFG